MSLSFTLLHHSLYFNPAGTRETESFHNVEHKSRKAPWARSSAEAYSSALSHEVSKSSVALLWASPVVRWETCSGRGTPWVTGGPLFTTCKLGFKGTVHPQINILSSFTHSHVDPNLYDFLSSVEHKWRGFKGDIRKYSLGSSWNACNIPLVKISQWSCKTTPFFYLVKNSSVHSEPFRCLSL